MVRITGVCWRMARAVSVRTVVEVQTVHSVTAQGLGTTADQARIGGPNQQQTATTKLTSLLWNNLLDDPSIRNIC
jgi:hypothetical protein